MLFYAYTCACQIAIPFSGGLTSFTRAPLHYLPSAGSPISLHVIYIQSVHDAPASTFIATKCPNVLLLFNAIYSITSTKIN